MSSDTDIEQTNMTMMMIRIAKSSHLVNISSNISTIYMIMMPNSYLRNVNDP